MVLALSIVISLAAVLHAYLADIYLTSKLARPWELTYLAPQELTRRLTAAWRAVGVAVVLSTLGIWSIKMNFMLVFYRLGHLITIYNTLWWIAVAVIIICGAINLGITPYDCLFEDFASIKANCPVASKIDYINSIYKANIAVDVISDFIS